MQGLPSTGEAHKIAMAKIRAHVVFPSPEGPEKIYVGFIRCLTMAARRTNTVESCPMTSSNLLGLYFFAKFKVVLAFESIDYTTGCGIPLS